MYYLPIVCLTICFVEKTKSEFNRYKLERMTDCLVELNNSGFSPDSARAVSLVDNDSTIYELSDDNRVTPLAPYDNVMIH